MDVCIRLVSAVDHSVKSKFNELHTWSSVEDSREQESSIQLYISNDETAFCSLEISCLRYGDRRDGLLVEVRGLMELVEGPDIFLDDFPVDKAIAGLRDFSPIVTAGSRYLFKRGESKTTVERTLTVEIPVLTAEPSFEELQDFDYDGEGDYMASCVGILFALYLSAKRPPIKV